MEKSKIKEVETKSDRELWDEITDEYSEEGEEYNFKEARNNLRDHPELYYLETDDQARFAMVKKRANNELIYETDIPQEVAKLKEVGIEKKDEL